MITGKRKSCMSFAILQFISCLLKGDFGSSHCRVHCAVMRRLCSPCFDSHFACQSPTTVYSYYYRTTFGPIQCETVVEIKYIHFRTNLRYLKLWLWLLQIKIQINILQTKHVIILRNMMPCINNTIYTLHKLLPYYSKCC